MTKYGRVAEVGEPHQPTHPAWPRLSRKTGELPGAARVPEARH